MLEISSLWRAAMEITEIHKKITEELRKEAMQITEDLRNDVMEKIRGYLPLKDYIKWGPICSSWSAVARNHCPRPPRFDLPYLVIQDPNKIKTRFCNLSSRRVYHYPSSELCGRYCCGSSQGWLVTIDINLEMRLYEPFSRFQIKLPSLPSPSPDEKAIFFEIAIGMDKTEDQVRRDLIVNKVILSADPRTNSDYIVITSLKLFEKLAFWKPGASTWTIIKSYYGGIIDMLWHKETLHLITDRDVLLTFDMEDGLIPIHRFSYVEKKELRYLVELRGELHIVLRDADSFVVLKFNLKKKQLTELKSIGDNALFLGRNHSMAIPSNEFIRCQSDSIYFTDDHGFEGLGNFNIKDETLHLFPPSEVYTQQEEFPPIWLKAHPW